MSRPPSTALRPARRAAAAPASQVWILASRAAPRPGVADVAAMLLAAVRARGWRHKTCEPQPGPRALLDVERSVRRALEAGCRRFVAVGGDGSVSMVASALARARRRHPGAVLGIVPAGTANVLARDLGLPLDPAAAIELALDGDHAITIDAMNTGERVVFTQLGVGLDAQMIRHTSREAQDRQGRFAYFEAFVRRALRHHAAQYDLEVDGEAVRVRAWQVVVANIGTMGTPPFTWGPGIDPSDGALDVCVYRVRSVRDTLLLIGRLLVGRHQADARTQFFRARSRVVIRGRASLLVQGDGELLGRLPITVDLVAGAVRVCVPRPVPVPEEIAAPPEPVVAPEAPAPLTPLATPSETITADVESMVAQESRTWVLQGWARHPRAFLGALDAALFLRVNSLPLGTVADRLLLAISRVMHYGEGWAIVALALVVREPARGLRVTLEALPVLWLTMLIVNFPLKRLFRRGRPFVAYVQARVVGPVPTDFSFPSGHTAAAFGGALLFSTHLPAFAPLFYALAALVGFSRIYLGVHYPSDVLVGGLVGTALVGGFAALLSAWLPRFG